MRETDIEEGEGEYDEDWEPDQSDGGDEMSARQVAQTQLPRPPSAFTDYSYPPETRGSKGYPTMSLNMQGKLPAHPSQSSFQPYPGSSQLLQPQQSQQFQSPTSVIFLHYYS